MDAKKSRNIMIIVLVTVVAVMLLATFLAVFLGRGGSNAENFLFKVDSGKAIITKYLGKDKELVIPSNLKGKKVGGFAENVFAESTLEKVEFAKKFSGEEISKNAFKDAKNLKSIILPNSIKTINEGAFENCTSLTVVKFGENVTTFGTRAFYGCYGLLSANPDNPDVAEFVLPASTTTIEMSAFYKCSNLEKVVVGDKLTKIGESAFESCSKLVNFVVSPKNIIDTIEKSAFNDTNIISKKNAKDATVNTELNFPKLVTIGEKAFYALRGSSNFEYFSIPSTVKTIGNYAFANNMALKEIHFAKDATITSFGIGVFSDLSWLASVTVEGDSEAAMASNHFPDSITKIPSLTFSGAYRLLNEKSFEIGKAVAEVGAGAFSLYNINSAQNVSNRTEFTKQRLVVNAENVGKYSIKNLPNYFKNNNTDTQYEHYLLMSEDGKIVNYIGGYAYVSKDSTNNCISEKGKAASTDFLYLEGEGVREIVKGVGGYAFAGVQFARLSLPMQNNFIGEGAFANSNIDTLVVNNKYCDTVEKDAFVKVKVTPASGVEPEILFSILVKDPDFATAPTPADKERLLYTKVQDISKTVKIGQHVN